MTGEEKRKHPRSNSLSLLSYVCIDENNEVVGQGMGRTLDLSEDGILLETHATIDPKHTVSLTIGLEDDLVDIKGKVVHGTTGEDGKYRHGIQFTETDESTLGVLKRAIISFKQ